MALLSTFLTVGSESPHSWAISGMRRPRRRSRLIRSTTSGVTFKSPPRRRLGVLYRRISAPEPQSYRLLDSVGRYVEPGQGVVSDERLATYLNQGKIRHVDTSQHGSGDRRVVCRPNPALASNYCNCHPWSRPQTQARAGYAAPVNLHQ